MSMDMALLKARGVSSGSYRKIFTAEPAEYPAKVKRLVDLISARIRDGRTMNLREARAYAAIDIAYDVPFNQTTPTLINNIMSQRLSAEDTVAALRSWGLKEEDLFLKVPIKDKAGFGLVPNPPVFFQIFVPLVKAYTTIRLAKIFNERNTDTILNYRPLKMTSRNQVLCEIMTDIAKTISTWYGYPSVLRQSIQQMLKYGIALSFTREEWDYQDELVGIDPVTGRESYETVKEGLRYILPHPTRMFYDQMYPLTSINSDTGCQFAGHWQVMKYGDILDNPMYWNRKSVFCGTNWFESPLAGNYFSEVYPCAMRFPQVSWGTVSREDKAAWYTSTDRDQAVFVTPFFMKLNPREWGLGEYVGGKLHRTYDRPIWHKFIVAGDDTVIWAEPCAYNPIWFMGYDYDEQAGRTPSLSLEIIPWQDHVGNILSQIILTGQQNLANFTFYDTNIVNKSDIENAKNLGSRMYRGMNFIGFDSTLNQRIGLDVRAAFIPAQLEKQNIQELLQMFPVVLSIMERVLQISAQEVGAAATHQQSKFELQQIGGASTNKVIFTGSYVDEALDAWGRQIHKASTAYLDPKISAEVSSDIPNLRSHLDAMGFTIEEVNRETVLVRGDKKALRLEGFASSNEGPGNAHEKEVSTIIFQTVGTVAAQPELFKKVGAKNLLLLLEQAAKMGGAPRDFKLNELPEGGAEEQVPAHILNAIQTAQQATLKAVEENLAKPIAGEIANSEQQLAQIQQAIQQLKGIYQIAASTQDKNRIAAEKSAADQQRKDAAFQREQQRKNATVQAEIERKKALTESEIQLNTEKARSQIAIDSATAAHSSALEAKAAADNPKPEA